MSFATQELARFSGKPVECYRFSRGASVLGQTSADRQIVLPVGTFDPITITREPAQLSREDSGDRMKITVSRTNPVVSWFSDESSAVILLQIYRAHRGDEANYKRRWTGTVNRAESRGSEVILECATVMAKLKRGFPTLTIQGPCNHVLYSTPCGANPTISRDAITVSTVSGRTVESGDFGVRPDQWFQGGRLEFNGEVRFIADHVGDVVTLISPIPGLESGSSCWALWGCDRLETTCDTKFGNKPNHLGFRRIPKRDLYEGAID